MNTLENTCQVIFIKRLFFLFLITLSSSNSYGQSTVIRLFEEAAELQKNGKFKDAVDKYDSIQFYQTANPKMYYNRALAYINMQYYSKALVDLNKTLTLDTGLYDAYFNRAFVNHMLRNDALAIGDYDIYLARFPEDIEARLSRGRILLSQKEANQAIIDLKIYTQQVKSNDDAYLALFFAYKLIDNKEQAHLNLDSAIILKPYNAKMYKLKADLYFDEEKYVDACFYYDKSLAQQSNNTDILVPKAEAKFKLGLYNDAAEAMENAIEVEPKNANFRYDRAFYLLQGKRYAESLLEIEQCIKLNYADLKNAYFIKAIANNNLGFAEAACEDFTKSSELGNQEAKKYMEKLCNEPK